MGQVSGFQNFTGKSGKCQGIWSSKTRSETRKRHTNCSVSCPLLVLQEGWDYPSLSPPPNQDWGTPPRRHFGPETGVPCVYPGKGPGNRGQGNTPPCGQTERQIPVKTLPPPILRMCSVDIVNIAKYKAEIPLFTDIVQ